jgi:hypothetical protein
MSLTAFDNLRSKHPDRLDAVGALERLIDSTLWRDPHAVIDDDIITQQLRVDPDLVRRLLVELESWRVLVRRLFWICPEGQGTASEASSLEEFPSLIECERCGQEHRFRSRDVEVKFLPSESLLREVRATQHRR